MSFDPMNMSLTDDDLREKLTALINEADPDFLRHRCSTPSEAAHALSQELTHTGGILYAEYLDYVLGLFLSMGEHLVALCQYRLRGEKLKVSDVFSRGLKKLSVERQQAIQYLQWALREWPRWKGEETPRYRQAMRFIESLGDEDKPCHICGAKPGEQGGVFCSRCSCVNCTWDAGRIVEFCPEHASVESSRECDNCGVWYNADWQTKCPCCGKEAD